MNILVSCDDKYLIPQKVALRSFFETNMPGSRHVIYMLRHKLSASADEELRSLVESFGGTYFSIEVGSGAFEGADTKSYISVETYFRLLAAEYLPADVDRVLWLDSDILVRKSLDVLYNSDFDGNWAVACSYGPRMKKLILENAARIGLSDPDKYFNAGVMLYNLDALRGADLLSRQKMYLNMDRKLMFPGQDLTNNLFDGHVKIVDYRLWNSMTHCVASKEDLDFAKENAAIVHFPGMAKPWKFNDIHFSDEWMAVFRRCQGDDADLDRVSYFGLKSMIEGAVKPAAPLECLVSVVIPAFNSAPTLPRCLDSIIPQLDERMELIVVDDGSSDGSFSMLMEKYGHNPLVRLARTTVNRGAVFARNDAIRLSRGRFIAFCDADDEWLPGKLFEQLSVMENDPATDIVFIQDVNVVEDGSGGSRRIHQMSLKDNTFHLRSCLVRKSVFERIGLLDETLTMRDDTEWIVRAVSTDSKYFVVDKELDVRHISSSGLSVKTLLNEKEKGRKRFEAFARGLRRRYFENSPIYDLSVLIPCMNASEYIAEAIKSCVSSRNLEIIVVDDGSSDGSVPAALKALEESGVPGTVVSRPHRSQAASRNEALSLARGEWIMYLDADDYFLPGALDDAMNIAEKEPAAGLFSFLCEDFISPELSEEQASRLKINPLPYRRMLAGCMLARKSLYLQVGGFDESLPSSETAKWVLKVRDAETEFVDSDLVTLRRRYHLSNFGRRDRQTQIKSYFSILRSRLKNKS